jgi:hypothetical protein
MVTTSTISLNFKDGHPLVQEKDHTYDCTYDCQTKEARLYSIIDCWKWLSHYGSVPTDTFSSCPSPVHHFKPSNNGPLIYHWGSLSSNEYRISHGLAMTPKAQIYPLFTRLFYIHVHRPWEILFLHHYTVAPLFFIRPLSWEATPSREATFLWPNVVHLKQFVSFTKGHPSYMTTFCVF